MILDKHASIQREQILATDGDKEEWSPVVGLEGFPINIQPANSETVALADGIFGKTYTVYTTQSGIRDGDKMTVSGTFTDGMTQDKTVRISDVANWSFGPLPHFEITCKELES